MLYACVIFLGAFLLFQIQPLIAKIILPVFGGSSVVWSTCMLFFQVVLLAGYAYAHWLNERVAPKKQVWLHGLLLLASLAVLPVSPDAVRRITIVSHPSWQILALLGMTIGVPYFLLSATSPLLQAWYARTRGTSAPYRLYALSNLASMLALLTYPVGVEPNLSTRHQGSIWSIAYIVFAVLCAAAAWYSARGPAVTQEAVGGDPSIPAPPGWQTRLLWIALAACASSLLLSVTNFLTQNVAAIPFLWVLPLSVYLLSFIICFDSPRLYWRPIFFPLLAAALGVAAYMIKYPTTAFSITRTILLSVATLFVFCMMCHGELVRLKPHPRHLTLFYALLSIGGALGGVFVALIAPNLFNAYHEFPISLAWCAVLAALVLLMSRRVLFHRVWGRVAAGALVAAVAAYAVFLGTTAREEVAGYRLAQRNFYGQLRVTDEEDDFNLVHRKLLHGVIIHGEQILDPRYRRVAISYFCKGTGISLAMLAGKPETPRRIGILGLGCGTLAAYGRAGDTIRIYEINPLVLQIAHHEFTYIDDTPARVETVLGDGRLSLEREPSQQFDVLVMDAFSGDSVPVHLITTEAFRTYLRHLKPGGILAVNVSNRYLDLKPVMERGATAVGRTAVYYSFEPNEDDQDCNRADWVLIFDNVARDRFPALLGAGQTLKPYTGFRAWTDDFSNMFRILK